MSRRRRARGPENLDRWVVSYADFITLLFAFFATLYAISVVDVDKAERLVESIQESFGNEIALGGAPLVLDGSARERGTGSPGESPEARAAEQRSLEFLGDRFRSIQQEVRDQDGMRVRETAEGLVVSLAGALVFASGSDALRPEAGALLGEIARLLDSVSNAVRVEGHTDSQGDPAHNWSLSSARAVAIVAALEQGGVTRSRLSTAGFADQRPLVSNRTEEGRRLNRRVDVVVLR